MRTLAEDFGSRLHIGAHLAELRRTRVGAFSIEVAATLDELRSRFAEEALGTVLVSTRRSALTPAFAASKYNDERKARHGMDGRGREPRWADGVDVRICDEQGTLIALVVTTKTDDCYIRALLFDLA